MERSGSRITPVRREILKVLMETTSPLSVNEIQERMGLKAGYNLVTLYRGLQLLEEIGIVHKIQLKEGYARFELAEPWLGHHHHLVCNGCGVVLDLPKCDLHGMVEEIRERFGFAVEQHTLDFYGRCPVCQSS